MVRWKEKIIANEPTLVNCGNNLAIMSDAFQIQLQIAQKYLIGNIKENLKKQVHVCGRERS